MKNIFTKKELSSSVNGINQATHLIKQSYPKKYLVILLITNLLTFLIGMLGSGTTTEAVETYIPNANQTQIDIQINAINSVASSTPQKVSVFLDKRLIIPCAQLIKTTPIENYTDEQIQVATIIIANSELEKFIKLGEQKFRIFPFQKNIKTVEVRDDKNIELVID